jgi:hypothetical protein
MKSSTSEQIVDTLKLEPRFSFNIHRAPPTIVFKGTPIEYDFAKIKNDVEQTEQTKRNIHRPRGGVKERARRALRESYLVSPPLTEQTEQTKRRPRGGIKEREKRELRLLQSQSPPLALDFPELKKTHSLYVDTTSSFDDDLPPLKPTVLPRPKITYKSLNKLEAKCKLSNLVWADEYSDTD